MYIQLSILFHTANEMPRRIRIVIPSGDVQFTATVNNTHTETGNGLTVVHVSS